MTEGNRYSRSLYLYKSKKKRYVYYIKIIIKRGVIMGYQFFHIETYARVAKSYEREITIKKGAKAGQKKTKKTETRSLKEIMEEQARIDEACPHVDDPRRPGLLYGVPPMEVLPLAEEWADQAKDSRGYKMKSDGNVAIVGVASLPREMEDDFPEFAENTLKWLKKNTGTVLNR